MGLASIINNHHQRHILLHRTTVEVHLLLYLPKKVVTLTAKQFPDSFYNIIIKNDETLQLYVLIQHSFFGRWLRSLIWYLWSRKIKMNMAQSEARVRMVWKWFSLGDFGPKCERGGGELASGRACRLSTPVNRNVERACRVSYIRRVGKIFKADMPNRAAIFATPTTAAPNCPTNLLPEITAHVFFSR